MEATTANIAALDNATPEKLTMMKIKGDLDRSDAFSDAGTPSHARRRLGLERSTSSMSMARSRQVTKTSSRRSSSFLSAHRSKMSSELTSQAESKFLSLMDIMASASREAASLREFWSRILEEREAYAQEKDELLEQVTEISTELEHRNSEHQKHGDEAGERKRHVDKLLIEVSTAVASVAAQKKLVTERDLELEKIRREISTLRESHSHTRTDNERIKKDFELIQLSLRTAEGDRDIARGEADQHKRDLQRTIRERTELTSKLSDITTKHEVSHREVLSLTDRVKLYESERDEQIHETERYKEDARKARLRAEDAAKELLEITEKLDRTSREVTKVKETIRTVESERDELSHTIEHLRREIKTLAGARDEAEEKHSDISLKYEHVKREVLSLKEKLRTVETESREHYDSLERTRESHRVIVIERDELRDEINTANRHTEDGRRQIAILTASLQKSESSLNDSRTQVFSHTERIKQLEIERDDHHRRNGHLHTEITQLKQAIIVFQTEIRTITEHRDRLRGDLEKTRRDYEEITEEITTFGDDSHELEFEIESLRTLLREVREQKESAISARHTADRERDEAVSRYEEKCREMERFEESAASHYHASHRSEGHGGSRIISRSTVVNHGHSESHSHGHGHGDSNEHDHHEEHDHHD